MASPGSVISPPCHYTTPCLVLTHVYPVCVGLEGFNHRFSFQNGKRGRGGTNATSGGRLGEAEEVGRDVGQPLLGTPAASDPLTTVLHEAPGRYRHLLALEERGYP